MKELHPTADAPEADTIEQQRPAVPSELDDDDEIREIPLEVPEADLLDQSRPVIFDDEEWSDEDR